MNGNKKFTPVQIGTYVVDAFVSETHQYDSEVTEFPVEQGSAISDNIRPKPVIVTVEGIVSDTPIGRIVDARNGASTDGSAFVGTNDQATAIQRANAQTTPSTDALTAMLAIRDARQPVTIVTTLTRFENMVMTGFSVPRDSTTGAALRFSATFQQITIVSNQRVLVKTLRTSSPNGQPKKVFSKAGKRLGLTGIPVQTWAVTLRVSAVATMGEQPEWTDSYGDHYRLYDNAKVQPDGFIGADNKYKPITPLDAVRGGVVNTNTSSVKYDPSTGTILNSNNKPVTQAPPSKITGPDMLKALYGGH